MYSGVDKGDPQESRQRGTVNTFTRHHERDRIPLIRKGAYLTPWIGRSMSYERQSPC